MGLHSDRAQLGQFHPDADNLFLCGARAYVLRRRRCLFVPVCVPGACRIS